MQNFINSMSEFQNTFPHSLIIASLLFGVILYIWLVIYIVIEVIIHEGGHCIFGLLTGYKFISFRIFNYTFVKDHKKLLLRRYNIPGSLGQCMMEPAEGPIENLHFILYIMGGVIADMIISIISFLYTFGPLKMSFIMRCMFLISFTISFGNVLLNGIPRKKGKINNDGTNLTCLLRDKQARISGFLQLRLAALFLNGYTYKDIPYGNIIVPNGADLTNTLIAWHKIYECYYHMDIRDWDRALECINKLEKSNDKKCRILQITEQSEKLFLYIKTGKNPNEIEGLYKFIKDVINKKNADFNLIRVRMAYSLYSDNSEENKKRIRKELDKKIAVYPYKGEAVFCSSLIGEMLDE